MPEAAKITIPVSTDAASAARDMDKLDKGLKDTSKSTQALNAGMNKLKGALAGAGAIMLFSKLGSVISQNNKLYAIQEKAETKLAAVVKATGGAAGFTAKELYKQAAAFQSVTTYGDEMIMEAQAILATFKGIQGDAFTKTTEMALNLSAAFGQDLKSSAIQLGKALEDPATGLSALRRIGVSFTEEQKAQIDALTKGGKAAEAQAIMLGVLEGQVGGVARAFALTATGAIKQFDNELGDTREKLGQITTNIQASFIPGMRQVNQTVNTDLVPALSRLSEAFLDSSEDSSVVAESMSGIVKTFAQVLDAISLLVNGFKFLSAGIRKTIAQNIESGAAHSAQRAANSMVKSFGSIENAIKAAASGNTRAKKQVDAYRAALEKQVAAGNNFNNATKDGIKALNGISGAIGDEKDKILENIEAQRKAREAREKARISAKALEEQEKKLKAAYAVLADTSLVNAIKAQDLAFKDQIKTVQAAGLAIAGLKKFQAQQQTELLKSALGDAADAEADSLDQRKANLTAKYNEIKALTQLSNEQRLAVEREYAEQSALIEQEKFSKIAMYTQQAASLASAALGVGQAFSDLRRAQAQKEIEAMKKKGATEEEIAQKEKELARQAAKDQKTFGIFSTIIDTAVGVTKAFATLPIWAAIPAAALIAAKGAIQTAAIAATPLPAAQMGGSFVVPPGAPADSGLLKVNQGEQVDVTPVRNTGQAAQTTVVSIDGNDFRGYITDEINRAFNNGSVQVRRKGAIKTA